VAFRDWARQGGGLDQAGELARVATMSFTLCMAATWCPEEKALGAQVSATA